MPASLLDLAPVETTSGTDSAKLAHYARKNDITKAIVTGIAITSLCGLKWTPTRDAKLFPICDACKEAYASLPQ